MWVSLTKKLTRLKKSVLNSCGWNWTLKLLLITISNSLQVMLKSQHSCFTQQHSIIAVAASYFYKSKHYVNIGHCLFSSMDDTTFCESVSWLNEHHKEKLRAALQKCEWKPHVRGRGWEKSTSFGLVWNQMSKNVMWWARRLLCCLLDISPVLFWKTAQTLCEAVRLFYTLKDPFLLISVKKVAYPIIKSASATVFESKKKVFRLMFK